MPKPVNPPAVKLVRLSVPVPVDVYARLCGLAALRQCDRSVLAAEFVKRGLRGVVVRDPGDPGESEESAA